MGCHFMAFSFLTARHVFNLIIKKVIFSYTDNRFLILPGIRIINFQFYILLTKRLHFFYPLRAELL